MKFSIKDFFSKCGQIHRKLRIGSHLRKKFLMENLFLEKRPLCKLNMQIVLNVDTCVTFSPLLFVRYSAKFGSVLYNLKPLPK